MEQQFQARLASIVECSDDAILSKDLDGTIRTWNPAAQRLFGYSETEIIGRNISLLIPPERRREEKMILSRLRRGERVEHYETVRQTKDGRLIQVSITVSPIRNPAGKIVGASKIIRDMTAQNEAATALRHSEERFRLVYQNAPVGLEQVALDDGKLLEVNAYLCDLLGYTHQELLSKSFAQITDPRDLGAERKLLRQLLSGTVPFYTIRKRYLHKDGRPIWVRVTSARGASADRLPYRISVIQNIDEQIRAELSLRESEQRLRAIVDTAVDAIITIDERGTMESANPATEKLFGYSASELIGKNVKMLMPEPYQSEHDGYLRNYLRTGIRRIIGIGREVTALRKDGSTFPMSLSVSEVALGNRKLFTGIVHDLSGRRVLEREIVDASTQEQRRIGQDLHDGLCQDLIGIAFQADFAARQLAAREAPETDVINKLAMTIREAAGQARQLSHGLNPVNLNAGGLPAALQAMADKVTTSFQVSCTFRWADEARAQDDLTATHLYRIAQEAISNAIKHGKAKRIQIQLSAAGERLTLVVRDNGIGLPQSLLHKANTAPPTGSTAPSLMGIGLHTMHYRANLIGGSFEIGPGRGKGTVVTCSIRGPLSAGSSVRQQRSSPVTKAGTNNGAHLRPRPAAAERPGS